MLDKYAHPDDNDALKALNVLTHQSESNAASEENDPVQPSEMETPV